MDPGHRGLLYVPVGYAGEQLSEDHAGLEARKGSAKTEVHSVGER